MADIYVYDDIGLTDSVTGSIPTLIKGTNCGFVTVAPVNDPLGTIAVIDTYAIAIKDVAPAGVVRVTEIGWWCDNATGAADYDVGIYSHDGVNDRPDSLIGSALNNAKGLTAGWKKVTGLDIAITPGTTYWIGIQLDNTATATYLNWTNAAGEKEDFKTAQTSLPTPWGASSTTNEWLEAFYAVVERATASVADAINVTDISNQYLTSYVINVYDTVGLTDIVQAVRYPLEVNVSDTIGLTDIVQAVRYPLEVNVSDTIGLTDQPSASIPILRISVYDSVGLTDGISRLLTSRYLIILLNDYVGGAAYSGFGQQYPVSKTFEWRTDRVAYDSGREQRNQIWSRPIRHWQINWQVMDENARDRLIEVFHRSRGMLRTFLWRDRDDYRASNIQIATNGVTTQYQLEQTYFANEAETWGEDKKDIAPETVYAPVIYHSVGGLQTRTTLNPPAAANQFFLDDRDGMLIWKAANPPAAGTLSCTFEFYFRVRFDYDEHTDVMFTGDYWRAEGLTLVEVIT